MASKKKDRVIEMKSGPVSINDKGRWLLSFARIDLGSLRRGELIDLHDIIQTFPIGPIAGVKTFTQYAAEDVEIDLRSEPDDLLRGILPALTISKKTILQIQADLGAAFDAFKNNREWTLPEIPGEWRLRPEAGGLRKWYFGNNFRKVFLATAADCLIHIWQKMRMCSNEKCKAPFLPVRQQKYCSVSCSRKLRWGRFLENHPDYYHAEYEKRAKAKAGTEKVRVGRHEKSQKPSVTRRRKQ